MNKPKCAVDGCVARNAICGYSIVNDYSECGAPDSHKCEHKQMPEGHAPDFHGKPVLMSCDNCDSLYDDSDGPEYGDPYWRCQQGSKLQNLRGFPFKTAQKCCLLHDAYLVDWAAEAAKIEATEVD